MLYFQSQILVAELNLFGFLLSEDKYNIYIWQYAKLCFFFFIEQVHVVTGLISTAQAP